MDVQDLVPGVLLPGFAGTRPPAWLEGELAHGLAGVCLFAGNIDPDDPAGSAALASEVHAARRTAIVSADEEGGVVTRLESRDGSTLPSAAQLGAVAPEFAERAGAVLGRRASRAGIDLVLAPVADVNDNPRNPVVGARSYGADPAAVADRVAAAVRGIRSTGTAACAKHWPGHGDTDVDSHLGVPTVPEATVLRHRGPFEAAIAAGVEVIMTAHLVVPEWGEEPATLVPESMRRLRALGFDGVIVTDAVDMAAIAATVGLGEGALRALIAGADLVCLGNPGLAGVDDEAIYRDVRDAVAAAVASGRLPTERLREAHARVAALGDGLAAVREAHRAGDAGLEIDDADAAAIAAALRALSAPEAAARLGDLGDVTDARRLATHAIHSRATPVLDALHARVSGGPVTAVIVDRADEAQAEAVAAARTAGEVLVVNVGALPSAHTGALELGADSRFSARLLDLLAGESR